MLIRISKDLKKQEIWANGVELASVMGRDRKNGKRIITHPLNKKIFLYRFNNPVLMTDNYRISRLTPSLRDSLFSLYSSLPRVVEYDDVNVISDYSHINVWSPSIDTMVFAKALSKMCNKNSNFKSAVEIGCGSGFLSKYVLEKCKKLKSILINDINPYAIKSAMDNIKDIRANFYAGDGLKKMNGNKFDLMICNPPYVPRPNSIDDNPYEGIGLLKHLVHNGQRYLNDNGILITNVSSLCWNILFKEKPKMKVKILEKMKVPLKVNNILNDKKWVNYLMRNGLKKKYNNGYEYWQELNIIMLKNTIS
ncbi:MAG TPA: class I SAM-dependent methyltransferase [Candidatus Nanoarchaeia archaeon]|nr:class I SAM-dependent methyltransferase [Candidatus Nanoarchaeia archaeon]